MKLEFEPTITKQYLLDRASQETYLEYYLGIPVKKGLFKSPLSALGNGRVEDIESGTPEHAKGSIG